MPTLQLSSLVLLLVCLMLTETAEAAALSPIALYTFSHDACSKRFFPNDANESIPHDLLIAESTSNITIDEYCEPSLGVRGAMSSNSSLSALLDDTHNDREGIAIELWWKPPPPDQDATILSIRRPRSTDQTSTSAWTPCNQGDGFDFELSWRYNAVNAYFRTSSVYSIPCQPIYFKGSTVIQPTNMTHFVIVLRDGFQAIYLNGEESSLVFWEPFDNDLSHWSNQDNRLYLLPKEKKDADVPAQPNRYNTTATLFQLALYPALNMSEARVRELLLAGLPYSPPFAFDQDFTINEDAEIVAGSHHVEWYENANDNILNDDATVLTKTPMIGNINEQVKALILESAVVLDIGTAELPTFVTQEPLPIYVYLTNLPDVGSLAFDGTILNGGGGGGGSAIMPLVPIGTEPVNELVYLPPHNAHSLEEQHQEAEAFTSFRYCISTNPIFDATQCLSSATIRVHVVPVNDPPVAIPPPDTVPVTEGITSSKIALLGSDVDLDDSIQHVRITRRPTYGSLILAVPTFRKDRIPHGTPLEQLNFTVSGDDTVYVQYYWPEAVLDSAGIVVQGSNVKDSFWFRVRDKHGLWSAEEKVEIQVLSAASATAEPTVTVDEDSMGDLQWRGNDRSDFDRRLGFFVEKLPSSQVGTLMDPSTGEPLRVGSTVKLADDANDNEVQIGFQASSNFCHAAEATQSDYDAEIRFRVVAYDSSGDTVVSVSDSESQSIAVACVLDVISMDVSTFSTPISILETSLERTTTNPCHSLSDGDDNDVLIDDGSECTAAAILHGIHVSSKDRKTDRAKVTVSTRSGYLSFNKLYWNKTEPVTGRSSMASGAVSFYAYPEDLTNIFSALHFQSYFPGQDSIDIELRYGSCSDINVDDGDNNKTSSSYQTPTCQIVRLSIPIEIRKDETKYKPETRLLVGFPWQILFCLLVYPLLYFAVVYLQSTCAGEDDDVTVVEGSPLEPVERFIQHQDENGMFYYEDTWDGTTRWDLPPDADFIPYEEIGT